MKTLLVALIALVLALSPVEKQLLIVIEEITDKSFITLNTLNNFDIAASEEIVVDQYKIFDDVKCKVDENLFVQAGLPSNFQLSLDASGGVDNIIGLW